MMLSASRSSEDDDDTQGSQNNMNARNNRNNNTSNGVSAYDQGHEDQGDYDDYDDRGAAATEGAVRFPAWVALSVLSVVGWIALLSRKHTMNGSLKWSLAITTLSMILGIICVLCHLFARGMFLSQPPEIIMAVLLLMLWSVGLPVIMNPKSSLAVGFTQVVNANLYFASWGAFIANIYIVGNLIKEIRGYDLIETVTPIAQSREGKWYALVATSAVVMGASIRAFKAFECTADVMQRALVCQQSKWAIAAGVIGTWISCLVTLFSTSRMIHIEHEFGASLIMLIVSSFGLGYVTFGEGPGHSIGNLYFSTWACFILSVLLFADCCRELMGVRDQTAASQVTADMGELEMDEVEQQDYDDVEDDRPAVRNE